MRNLITIVGAIVVSVVAYGQELNWLTDFEQAKTKATEENTVILMSFQGSDWCGNCKRLEKVLFQSEDFKAYAAEHLILLKLDFPMKKQNKLPDEQVKHNEALAEQYNPNGMFPKDLLLTASGEKLGEFGYKEAESKPYIDYISSVIP